MRKKADYPTPSFTDPMDRRFVSIINPSEEAKEGAVNILGVPYDGATLGRKGSALAPQAIRESLRFNSTYDPEFCIDISAINLFDLGDILPRGSLVNEVHKEIRSEVRSCIKHKSLLIVLGGDNSISLPCILALSDFCDKLGLVVLDSHYDMRGELNGQPSSGSSYYLAIKELGERLKGRVAIVGLHGFLNSADYAKRARELEVEVFTADDVMKEGAFRTARRAYSIASEGSDSVYVSIDMDSIGLAEVSGVSAPSPSGLSSKDALRMSFFLSTRNKVRVVDIVETSPSNDPTGRSQVVAASLLVQLTSGFRAREMLGL